MTSSKLKKIIKNRSSFFNWESNFGSFSANFRFQAEVKRPRAEQSRAENPSARAMAWASSARLSSDSCTTRYLYYINSAQLSPAPLLRPHYFPYVLCTKVFRSSFCFPQKLFWTASWKKVSICGWILFRETKKRLRKLALTQSIQSPKQA